MRAALERAARAEAEAERAGEELRAALERAAQAEAEVARLTET